jgi:hypothetical protein
MASQLPAPASSLARNAAAARRACAPPPRIALPSQKPRKALWEHSGTVGDAEPVNENFSLIVMCVFLLGSLAFLAEQLTSYH